MDGPALSRTFWALEVARLLLLLDCKANVNAHYGDKWTDLICASDNEHLEVIQLLMRAGANVSAKYSNCW